MRPIIVGLAFLIFTASTAFASDIIIGVAGPMTGGLAAFGEQIQNGTQIAVEQINEQGGLLGQKLSVMTEDDACDPKQAQSVANKMLTQKAAVVFGHWCASASMAASSVYGEEGILQIDVGGLLVKFTKQGFPTLFRVSANSKYFASVIGRYTQEHNPKARVALIKDQPAVTKELAEELKSFFSTTTNPIVAVEDIRGGDKDFSSLIDRLKMQRPEVIICSCFTIEAGLLARQMAEKGLDVYYYGWDTFNSPDFLNILGKANTGKIVSLDYARAPQSADYEKLAAILRKRQMPVETTTILTYAAFQIFADAVKTANSFDADKITKVLHRKTFSTILGDVAFDQNGDRINPAFASYQWVNGVLKMTGSVP